MAETLATRVTRILASSAHALIDAMEELGPEAMMRQAIREVDQVLAEVRADLGKIEAAKHLITTQMNKLNTENEQLAAQIETALAAGQEDLARAGIERQTLIDDQTPVLQRSLAEQRERARELEGYIAALLAKRREMEETMQQWLASRSSKVGATSVNGKPTQDARVDDARSAFDRVLARETQVNNLLEGAHGDAQKLKELQELARQHRIEERLTQLKSRMQG